MKYFKNLKTNEVFGYDTDQQDLIAQAITNEWEDVTDSWPPVQEPYIPTYSELRAAEYPPITDYLDGLVKSDTTQIQKYIDDCLAVKEKYPKT